MNANGVRSFEDDVMGDEEQGHAPQHPGQEHHVELPVTFPVVVRAAAEAATMSLFTALASGALRLPHCAPDPPQPAGTNENRSSDDSQSETEARQPYQRTCPGVVSA